MQLRDPIPLAKNFLEVLRKNPLSNQSSERDIYDAEMAFARLFEMNKNHIMALKPDAQNVLGSELTDAEFNQIKLIFEKGNLLNYGIFQTYADFRNTVKPVDLATHHIPPRPNKPAPPLPPGAKNSSPPPSPNKISAHRVPNKPLPPTPSKRTSSADSAKKYNPGHFKSAAPHEENQQTSPQRLTKSPIKSSGGK